jgi:hypothetical protein
MKIFFNNFFTDPDLFPFFKLFKNVFNEDIQLGELEDSDILFESVFGDTSVLYHKKWLYSFLFIGEADRRLHVFIKDGINNERLKDYSCVLKGEKSNKNIINFPLFVFYCYSFEFTYKFVKHKYDEKRFNVKNMITNIPPKDVCVIISNGIDSEGRNFFIDELEKRVKIDYAGAYKNNVESVQYHHCSPGFIDFVSQYKIIISMENSKNKDYITEKILNGFASNTIPIYWGSDNILDYFNEERFVNVKSFSMVDINNAIEKIIVLLNEPYKYLEMINKPIYKNNAVPLTLTEISQNIKNLLNINTLNISQAQYNPQYKKFITFGCKNFYNSVGRLCEEAKNLNFFDEIIGFRDAYLKKDETFWKKHGSFIEKNKRGYGYMIWKSYLVKNELDKLKENDILIFCDAGVQINLNGKKRLLEYIDMLNTNKEDYGIISFQLEYKEILYTKRVVFEHFGFDEKNKFLPQCITTVIMIRKNQHSSFIINEWCKNCENYNLINDNTCNENELFIENRHDQSVLSMLVNEYGSIKLLDETFFSPNWDTDGAPYPFLCKRLL